MSSDRSSNCVCACDPRQYVRSVRIANPASTRSGRDRGTKRDTVCPAAQPCCCCTGRPSTQTQKLCPCGRTCTGRYLKPCIQPPRAEVRMKVGYARRCLRGRTHADTLHRSNIGECQMHECCTAPMMRPAVRRTVTLRQQTCILERCIQAQLDGQARGLVSTTLCAPRGAA